MLLATLLLTLTASCSWSDEARLEVIADTSLQAHPSEVALNSGASPNIRIKGNEHYMLLKLDVTPILGWRVESAGLRLHAAGPHMLRTMGVSTISADWSEGTGRGEKVAGGCTFTRAVWPDGSWAGPGSTFLDVALQSGGTQVSYADIRQLQDGWIELDIAPQMLQSLLAGASYGLCISDEKGQTRANNDVHSREQSASAPYVLVTGAPAGDAPSPRVEVDDAEPWPQGATFDSGALKLRLRAFDALRFEVSLAPQGGGAAIRLPLYRTPRPLGDGTAQEVIVPGLAPGTDYAVSVTPVDLVGRAGPPASIVAKSSAAKPAPRPLVSAPAASDPAPEGAANALHVWALPAECKVNPLTGSALEEVGADSYGGPPAGQFSRSNPAFGAHGGVLHGARGEVVALQVVVESGAGTQPQVSLRFAPSGDAAIPAPVGIYRNWYVRDGDAWYAEYMVPLDGGGLTIPPQDNGVPGQRNQSFTIIWELPRDLPPGPRTGRISVQAGEALAELPITLHVAPFEVPAATGFDVDLNCYGPVCEQRDWATYLRWERAYYAAAHALRCDLNPLGYSQSGGVYRGCAPAVEGEGAQTRIVDWGEYDEHYGPYLDGSAFGGVRAGVPVSHMYLPLHESWPLPIGKHYSAANDIRKYPDNVIAHALNAPPIQDAFDEPYKQAMVAAGRQLADHFRERGWTRTQTQCYLNNKYYFKDEEHGFRGTSWWLLDEPMHRDDWLALRFYAELFRDGAGDMPSFAFRGDISRPQWQRDWLDGLVDVMCVSSALFDASSHCRRFRDQGVTLWHYGTANPIGQSNLNGVAWALAAFTAGADGIVPWNSIGGDGAFSEPTPTALLVPGTRFGIEGPVASLRLLSLCRGEQDVEYLRLLGEKENLDREQLQKLVAGFAELSAEHRQDYVDDAGRVQFGRLSLAELEGLRRAVAGRLGEP